MVSEIGFGILTRYSIDGSQGTQHSNRPDGGQIEVLHMHHVLQQAGQDDKEVQAIPGVGQIRVLAAHAHGHHLDGHLQGKEGKDDVVEDLKGKVSDLRQEKLKVFKIFH